MAIVNTSDDDKLVFADSKPPDSIKKTDQPHSYKLLIVDDDQQVHNMTRMVLSDYTYKGASLEFLSARSIPEARDLILSHPDAACILLDVVMETNDAGLEIARFIREDVQNTQIRIILRTGQPGKAPEKKIILDYDINDYKEKTELTEQKLFTCITTALRSYIHLIELDEKQQEIAAKNLRLNEEIARRIVAEHNLTKYNRSLEKTLETKTLRLKNALAELDAREQQLKATRHCVCVTDMSRSSLDQLQHIPKDLEQQIGAIDQYRNEMTWLLEKYQMLQEIITCSRATSASELSEETTQVLTELEQVKKEIHLGTLLKKYPVVIQDATKSIAVISTAVNDIKRFMAIDNEPAKIVDINQILTQSIQQVSDDFTHQISIQTDFGTLPGACVCPENMQQAFCEIIKNALQALAPKGIVSVSSEFVSPEILVHVCDLGAGISPETIDQVFKPYFSRNKQGAKGLGLSLARAVILKNNGSIEISSLPNEGTTVLVKVPACIDPC